jgi:HSP20 family protein
MAEVNVERRQEERGRGVERRSQGGGLTRRGEWGLGSDIFSMSPFTLMRRLTEDMDRMFGGFGSGGGASSWPSAMETTGFIPPVEVREQDGNLIVCAELPGINKEDVKVQVEEDALIIQGERKREWDEERGGVRRSERSYGSFYRAIPLPEGANLEQAKAEFRDGVLEVRVPVPEQARRSRQIPIEAGTGERKAVGSQQQQQQTQRSKAG